VVRNPRIVEGALFGLLRYPRNAERSRDQLVVIFAALALLAQARLPSLKRFAPGPLAALADFDYNHLDSPISKAWHYAKPYTIV
jgi:hypothetical protein